ncbi:hypothetical protein BKI52_09135 [marine bacterium AO1-C]|nr:hypothetical protein BKI52_09135 [marine bacterium AO1-C]
MKRLFWVGYIAFILAYCTNTQAQSKLRLQVQIDHKSGKQVRMYAKNFYLTGGSRGNIIKWDRKTERVLWVIRAHTSRIRDLYILKDQTFITTNGSSVKQWDTNTGTLIKKYYEDYVVKLNLSPLQDKLFITSGGRGDKKLVIDLKKREKIKLSTKRDEVQAYLNDGKSTRFSRDRKYIFYTANSKSLSIWSARTMQRLWGDFNIKDVKHCIYLPKEKILYTVNENRVKENGRTVTKRLLRQWNIITGKITKTLPYQPYIRNVFAFESLPYFLVSLNDKVEFRDKKTTQLIKTLDKNRVDQVYITPDKKQLIFKERVWVSWVYDLAQGKIVQRLDRSKRERGKQLAILNGLEAKVTSYAEANKINRQRSQPSNPTLIKINRKSKFREIASQQVFWGEREQTLRFKDKLYIFEWDMKHNRWAYTKRKDNVLARMFVKGPRYKRKYKVIDWPETKRQFLLKKVNSTPKKYRHEVSIWDIESQKMIMTFEGIRAEVNFIKPIDAQTLFVANYNEILFYRIDRPKPLFRFPVKTSTVISSFAPTRANYWVIPGRKEILLYDFALLDNAQSKTIKHYSLETGKLMRQYEGHQSIVKAIRYIPNTDYFISIDGKGVVKKWNHRTGQDVSPKGFKIIGNRMVILPDNQIMMTPQYLNFWSLATGQKTFDLRKVGFGGQINDWVILPDKQTILFAKGRRNRRNKNIINGQLYLFNYKTQKLLFKKSVRGSYPSKVILLPDQKTFLTIQNDDQIFHWSLTNGELLTKYQSRFGVPSRYRLNKDSTQMITTHQLGAVTLWDLQKRQEKVSVIVRNSEDYIVISPKGYYTTTKSTIKNIHYVQNNKILLFDQLDLVFNRPDKILQAIGVASRRTVNRYKRAYKKRLKGFGLKEEFIKKLMESDFDEEYDYPQIFRKGRGANRQTIPFRKPVYKVKVAILDKKTNLDRYNIYVNGVALYGKNGQDLGSKNLKRFEQELAIPLSQGKNNIEITALNNQGVSAIKEKFQVIFTPNKPLPKPTLHIVAIGVSQYKNKKYQLNFARKDAQDMVAAFTQNSSDLFKEVKTYPLFDKGLSTKQLERIKKKLLQTRVDDYVLVFYAGHGLLDENQDYFLGTHSINFTNPKKGGLPYQQLENLIDGIPARQKLLLVDACHSGEVDKDSYEEVAVNTDNKKVIFRGFVKDKQSQKKQATSIGLKNSYQLMKELYTDLRKGTGATILSSAGGGEFALESKEWNNGVFTYSVLNGLKNKKADRNKDGKIMLSELQDYLYDQVQKLTNGKQHPTSRIKNLSNDFRIW